MFCYSIDANLHAITNMLEQYSGTMKRTKIAGDIFQNISKYFIYFYFKIFWKCNHQNHQTLHWWDRSNNFVSHLSLATIILLTLSVIHARAVWNDGQALKRGPIPVEHFSIGVSRVEVCRNYQGGGALDENDLSMQISGDNLFKSRCRAITIN